MKAFALSFLLGLAATAAFARGGGGCFEEGTLILTPTGDVPIEQLRVGDSVCALADDGQLQPATVRAITRVEPAEYLEVPGGVRVTAEHPFQTAPGVFREAGYVFVGARRLPATRPAYNLLVTPGGTFVAGGFVVHNKGCFLPDTPILRADGSQTSIRDVRPGDELLAFNPDGTVMHATVRTVVTHVVDEYLIVTTDHVSLRVTVEHPFYIGDGTFKTLESLRIGDTLYAYDGHGLSPQRLASIERVRVLTRVYNLQTDAPNTFFAHGIAVHNKGGGCFPAGTPIRTPRGEVAIESLKPGDVVLSGQGGPTDIEATFVTRAPVLSVETDVGTLRTTAEHPLLCGDGRFRPASELSHGDRLGRAMVIRCVPQDEQLVFNLRVDAPHTFVASGFVVHNKGGGCFPAGTRIRTPHGDVAIETLQPGDVVLSGDGDKTTVEAVSQTRDRVLTLWTDRGILHVTVEHPLLCRDGQFRLAGDLSPGDRLGGATVQRFVIGGEQLVFNLRVGAPHTFVADGFVVHNKGGGGFRSGGSGKGSGDPRVALIIVGVVVVLVIYQLVGSHMLKERENLDFVHSVSAVKPKVQKTRKLLEFIAKVDPAFALEALRQAAESTFVTLQKCWQARDYGPMKPLMMPDLYADHCAQLASMRRNHEINVIAQLNVERVDIVNVRYPHKEDEREFTALITASALDYYEDDRNGEWLRGDEEPARFQEFWTFQRQSGAWLLREIEQSRESDVLQDENFFEQFTDKGVDRIYGETAGKAGPTGPWLEPAVETKATRVERLLNFLVRTDKIWNRQAMLERSREVFLRVMLAQESGDPAPVLPDMFPQAAVSLKEKIDQNRELGFSTEFRNLCVRKVELLLVRNFSDNTRDEFTVRISAHAQKIVRRAGAVLRQDEYVSPFIEYWTFGRLNGEWRLKEVLPPARGEELVNMENLDQDSTPEQLQWYYRQTRAV